MCNQLTSEETLFCKLFYISWLLKPSVLLCGLCHLNIALHFRQSVSRLTSLHVEQSRQRPTKNLHLAAVLKTSETWACSLFFFTTLNVLPLCSAVNNGFWNLSHKGGFACELALIINVAPFRQICRLLGDLAADKCASFCPCLAGK